MDSLVVPQPGFYRFRIGSDKIRLSILMIWDMLFTLSVNVLLSFIEKYLIGLFLLVDNSLCR
jgi:hypothetical protein